MSRLRIALSVAAGAVLFVTALPAGASPALPTPGTASQVTALVSAALKVSTLPTGLVPSLAQAPNDNAGAYYKSAATGCSTTKQCVYGDTKSSTTVVLYGDSHAQMWLPALAPVASFLKFRLVVLWHQGCPEVDVTNAWAVCRTVRTNDIEAINKLHPTLVLLGNKTTNIVGPGGVRFTNAQWEKGLETTIKALATPTTKVAVIGDINQFDSLVPQCLAANAKKVQKCSIFSPNPKYTQHFTAEKDAAAIEKVPYINPQVWLCTTKCSAVIGKMIVYSDQGHVTATYAEYLTNVWETKVAAALGT